MTATITETDLNQLVSDDATCEVKWKEDDPVCGKPATHVMTCHSGQCENGEARTCDECLATIFRAGVVGDRVFCKVCGQSPVVWNIRPI